MTSLKECEINWVNLLGEASKEPDEGLLELVIRLGRDIVVLKVLLSVEGDLLGLDLSVLNINLVANEDDRNVLTDTGEVLKPLGHVGVGDSGADIEHDDTAVSADVVTISESTEFLLAGGVPNVEFDLAMVCEEWHWMDLNTEGRNVLLFELSGQVTLHKGSLADAAISDENELEFRDLLLIDHSII